MLLKIKTNLKIMPDFYLTTIIAMPDIYLQYVDNILVYIPHCFYIHNSSSPKVLII